MLTCVAYILFLVERQSQAQRPLSGGQEHIRIVHMTRQMESGRMIILASASQTRAAMLQAAGIEFSAQPARIDEAAVRLAMMADSARPRDIADALADLKAAKLASRFPEALVIGCDQVLEFRQECLGKADTPDAGRAQLQRLRGKTHLLHSAVVIYKEARPAGGILGRRG